MILNEAKEWLPFLQEAPEVIRECLIYTFWFLIFLVLIFIILKLLFSENFKKLYEALNTGTKHAANSVVKSLELPEPYPKLTKFFAIVFMLNNYAVSFIFASLFLVFSILFITSDIPGFIQRIVSLLFSVIIGYITLVFFVQAEQDRVKFFKKKYKDDENS